MSAVQGLEYLSRPRGEPVGGQDPQETVLAHARRGREVTAGCCFGARGSGVGPCDGHHVERYGVRHSSEQPVTVRDTGNQPEYPPVVTAGVVKGRHGQLGVEETVAPGPSPL